MNLTKYNICIFSKQLIDTQCFMIFIDDKHILIMSFINYLNISFI